MRRRSTANEATYTITAEEIASLIRRERDAEVETVRKLDQIRKRIAAYELTLEDLRAKHDVQAEPVAP